jgi:hypothetical protein
MSNSQSSSNNENDADKLNPMKVAGELLGMSVELKKYLAHANLSEEEYEALSKGSQLSTPKKRRVVSRCSPLSSASPASPLNNFCSGRSPVVSVSHQDHSLFVSAVTSFLDADLVIWVFGLMSGAVINLKCL